MHFELGCKETCDGGKDCAQDNADKQRQNNACNDRQPGKIKHMAKNRTGVDSLVHNDGSGSHAHTNHTANGQVRAGQQDQPGNAQSQEHARRSLLQNVQNIVDGKQRHFLAELGNQAQYNKDDNDCNVQTVAQQKVTAIKCVLVVFPLLRQRLANRKLGQAQHIDQVIFVIKRSMPAVLDCLAVLIQLHFGVEQAVLVNILFVLDFLLIAQLGKRRLVFLFQLFYSCLIFLLGLYLFLLAAGHHRLVIVAVIMGFQIGFGISDQLVDLALVFFFNCLGRCQFSLQFGLTFRFFLRGIDAVALQVIQLILDIDSFFSTVSTKFIDLRLDFPNIFIDWLAKLGFLLRRKNF